MQKKYTIYESHYTASLVLLITVHFYLFFNAITTTMVHVKSGTAIYSVGIYHAYITQYKGLRVIASG